MRRFYGNVGFITCGNGCNAKLQAVSFDENQNPYDVDWDTLIPIYNNHIQHCSPENPLTTDNDAFYGNPDECMGFKEDGNPDSGYNYCEF